MLIIELAHPVHRGPLTTMYNTLWYVNGSKLHSSLLKHYRYLGSIVAAWTVFGTVQSVLISVLRYFNDLTYSIDTPLTMHGGSPLGCKLLCQVSSLS